MPLLNLPLARLKILGVTLAERQLLLWLGGLSLNRGRVWCGRQLDRLLLLGGVMGLRELHRVRPALDHPQLGAGFGGLLTVGLAGW